VTEVSFNLEHKDHKKMDNKYKELDILPSKVLQLLDALIDKSYWN